MIQKLRCRIVGHCWHQAGDTYDAPDPKHKGLTTIKMAMCQCCKCSVQEPVKMVSWLTAALW